MTEPNEQLTDEQQQRAAAEFHRAVQVVEEQGVEDLGPATFNEMAQTVVDAIGGTGANVETLMRCVLDSDAPTRIIQHLSEHPERAAKLKGKSLVQVAAEIGRIEAQLFPDRSGAGAEPAWITRAKGGNKPRLTDDASDRQFESAWKKRYPNGFVPPSSGGPRSVR